MFIKFGLLVLTVLVVEQCHAYCCFQIREPLVYTPSCGCGCGLEPVLRSAPVPSCCEQPICGCFKDVKNTCQQCPEKQKDVCSCLTALKGSCGCSYCDETLKSFVYFPEVEYPVRLLESLEPFYFSTCLS